MERPAAYLQALGLAQSKSQLNQRMNPSPVRSTEETEVIFLKSALDSINALVNNEMFTVTGNPDDATIMFPSVTHQRLFNVLLVDFLSRTDKRGPVSSSSFLSALRTVCSNPRFGSAEAVANLKAAVNQFTTWLEERPSIQVWLPSVERNATLAISRIDYLKMAGDLAKHDPLRAVGVAEDLQRHLGECEVPVDLDEALLALPDFYERFHSDILNYHASYIAEMLNNIRWGIHTYLCPHYHSVLESIPGDPPRYQYRVPKSISSQFARVRYWDLMNDVRSTPYVAPFKTTVYLRKRY